MSAIRPQFQVLPRAPRAPEAAPRPEPPAGTQGPLPQLATAADVRGVVLYLRKKTGGVTINEAVDAIKKQVFDPRKVQAYEALGLVQRQGDRLKLTPLGHDLGRRLQPVAQSFRALLDGQPAYRGALAWGARQGLDVIVQADVARFWREAHPAALAAGDERAVEASVVCFFQLCQAAALGTVIIGKKGQPTRLRVEHDELTAYLNSEPTRDQRTAAPEQATQTAQDASATAGRWSPRGPRAPQATEALRVLVSRGPAARVAEQVRAALELADIESRVLERVAPAPLPNAETLAVMHECDAAVVVVTRADWAADELGRAVLHERLRLELGALYALYRGRVVCLWELGAEPPAELQPLTAGTFEGGAELPWTTVAQLVRAVKQFRADATRAPDA
ncbi:MAG TPA: hypothetical protein VF546_17880 [Pyrinomonadaceae bacterium]|jgi:hypothetical protein